MSPPPTAWFPRHPGLWCPGAFLLLALLPNRLPQVHPVPWPNHSSRWAATSDSYDRLVCLTINLLVSLSMLLSLPLCLVGWCWSVGWGISLLNIASELPTPSRPQTSSCPLRRSTAPSSSPQPSPAHSLQRSWTSCLWSRGAPSEETAL